MSVNLLQPYPTSVLLSPFLTIFLLVFFIALQQTHSILLSFCGALLKSCFFFIYFRFFFDTTYNLFDDVTYLNESLKLYNQGVNIFNFFNHLNTLNTVAGGQHYAYYIYNIFSIQLFGVGYYAPVALNVIFTTFIALIGVKIAKQEFKWSKDANKLFFVYLLLQPDIFIWSNTYNLKDIWVLFFHVSILWSISAMVKKVHILIALVVLFISVVILFHLRLYVPILISLAFFTSIFFRKFSFSYLFFLFLFGLGFLSLLYFTQAYIPYAINELENKFVNPIFGFVHFILSPVPFHTDKNYQVLDIPALFYWISLPFCILGMRVIHRLKSFFSKFFLFYVFIFVVLYSVYAELQGPRHRIQLDFALSVFQFSGIFIFLKVILNKNKLSRFNVKNEEKINLHELESDVNSILKSN